MNLEYTNFIKKYKKYAIWDGKEGVGVAFQNFVYVVNFLLFWGSYVPSLVELTLGVLELWWNIYTLIYI